MRTNDRRVTHRALGWAIGMTVVLYVMLWVAAGPPAGMEAAPADTATTRVHTGAAGGA